MEELGDVVEGEVGGYVGGIGGGALPCGGHAEALCAGDVFGEGVADHDGLGGLQGELLECGLEEARVGLEVADFDGDGDGVPADIEAGFAEVGAEAFAAEGAVGDDAEAEAALAEGFEGVSGTGVGEFSAFGAGDVDGIEEFGCEGGGEVDAEGAGCLGGDVGVVGFDEGAGPGGAHGFLHGVPAGAGEGIGCGAVEAVGGHEGSGAFGGAAAEFGGRGCPGCVPEGIADIEEDRANGHGWGDLAAAGAAFR